jgi:hypothetical protein
MKVIIDTESLWGIVRTLNDRSQLYSDLADEISRAIQQLEMKNKEDEDED